LIFKPGISYFIILIIRMLSAVHFYNQLTLKTYKINNISADNRLPAEFNSRIFET
jgi:hypothetical protein